MRERRPPASRLVLRVASDLHLQHLAGVQLVDDGLVGRGLSLWIGEALCRVRKFSVFTDRFLRLLLVFEGTSKRATNDWLRRFRNSILQRCLSTLILGQEEENQFSRCT
jgi:hypothetical protein